MRISHERNLDKSNSKWWLELWLSTASSTKNKTFVEKWQEEEKHFTPPRMAHCRKVNILERSNVSKSSLVAQSVENLPAICRGPGFDSWFGEIPWRRNWQPAPGFLPGESHDRGAWEATVYSVARVRHDLVTKPLPLLVRFVCKLLWCLWAAKSLSPVKKRIYILP